jgi:hypothetical protein
MVGQSMIYMADAIGVYTIQSITRTYEFNSFQNFKNIGIMDDE